MAINSNRFEEMLDFQYIPEWDRDNIIHWLHTMINNNLFNAKSTDTVDYQKIIYVDLNYKDDAEIVELIKQVKTIISNNYCEKKKVISACQGI